MLADTETDQEAPDGDIEGNSALRTVRAGFIPLVDCAILVVAREKGFAGREGIQLDLSREASWSNIRDRLTVGQLDCAHMLAGMAIASALEIGNPMARVVAPMGLGLNGNAITVSNELWDRMAGAGGLTGTEGPAETGAALARIVAEDKAAGRAPMSFGMVYPYSSHNYELRYWMAAAGIHPDRDIRLAVVPPPYMPDYLRNGFLDGFCVGEPWNSIAVHGGCGRIVATKPDLCRLGPEKVLGVRADWAARNAESLDALIRALIRAADWAGAPDNRRELADILARPEYLDVPATLIGHILAGNIVFAAGSPPREVDDYVVFSGMAATFPWESQALWLYSQMARWGQVPLTPTARTAATRTYRPDLYDRAIAGAGAAARAPDDGSALSRGTKLAVPSAFFDGIEYDPEAVESYVNGFGIHARMT